MDGAGRGSALLLAAAATAALAVLAALLLTASALSYERLVLRSEGIQARLLAEAAILQAQDLLAEDGGLWGLLLGRGSAVWDPPLPQPPPGFDSPPALELGASSVPREVCGSRVELTLLRDEAGAPRRWLPRGGAEEPFLVQALGRGWCRRGRAGILAAFAARPGQLARRLY